MHKRYVRRILITSNNSRIGKNPVRKIMHNNSMKTIQPEKSTNLLLLFASQREWVKFSDHNHIICSMLVIHIYIEKVVSLRHQNEKNEKFEK